MYGIGNPYAPQYNAYAQSIPGQQFQQQIPRQEVVKVNGENGARAFPIGANSSALLLDESGTLVWLVTTDGAGYKTVAPYDITPHQIINNAPDFSNLELRITRLEEMVNGNTSNTTAARNESSPTESEFLTNQKSNGRSPER